MSMILARPPRRILVRGVNWLGDAVMTTPALRRLREKFPDAHITWLGPEKLFTLWRNHPAVDETISFAPGEGVFSVAKKIRAGRFDLALVLPNSPRSALEVFLAGVPERIGYARPLRSLFLTRAIPPRRGVVKMQKRTEAEIKELVAHPRPHSEIPTSSHHIYDYLHLTAALGADPAPLAPQLVVTPEEVAAVLKGAFLADKSASLFGLNPGAEYGPAKRWPVEKFITAAKEIHRQTGCVWILFGGKSDQTLTAQIAVEFHADAIPHLDLAGRTDLRELLALLKQCRVLLTNDTGPMHLAAALGTPVVVPFGSTSPELTGPGLPGDPHPGIFQSTAPCAPCFLRECPIDFRCLRGIEVPPVVAAVLALASRPPVL